jgi:hypothetical protein
MSHHKCTFQKINNFNPTRGNSFKNRVQSTMHFQIKGREQRSIHWLIDSRRDIGPGKGENGRENALTIFARISFYSVGNGNGKVRNGIRSVKSGSSKMDKSKQNISVSIDKR